VIITTLELFLYGAIRGDYKYTLPSCLLYDLSGSGSHLSNAGPTRMEIDCSSEMENIHLAVNNLA
jgi:hypothetical protein